MSYDYPTGSDNVPDGLNSSGDADFDAVFDQGYFQGKPNDITKAGVLSPYRTMGQGGNVWEWNETAIDSSRVLRGGAYLYGSENLLASMRSITPPLCELEYFGFRVASTTSAVVPAPSTLVGLVSMGAIGLLGYVWRRRRGV